MSKDHAVTGMFGTHFAFSITLQDSKRHVLDTRVDCNLQDSERRVLEVHEQ